MAEKYTTINLPQDTIEKLKRLKIAYAYSTGEVRTYGQIIDGFIEGLKETEPQIFEAFRNLSSRDIDGMI